MPFPMKHWVTWLENKNCDVIFFRGALFFKRCFLIENLQVPVNIYTRYSLISGLIIRCHFFSWFLELYLDQYINFVEAWIK